MAKVGIYIFTDKCKERQHGKDIFDHKKYYGFKRIIQEVAQKHKTGYASSANIDEFDFVLVSITSFFDVLNLWKDMPKRDKRKRAKVILGGPGVYNLWNFKDFADFVVIGRGENLINDIIDGEIKEEDKKSIWNFHDDPNIKKVYQVREVKDFITIEDYEEKTVGCRKRCFFCYYAWKNKYSTKQTADEYTSGFSDFEDTIENLDFRKKGLLVTAIDGDDEKSRKIVNKNITKEMIRQKLEEFYTYGRERQVLKIYNIIGYPWQTALNNETLKIIKKIDKKSGKKLTIFFHYTHFNPCPLTPMESEPLNLTDFRIKFKKTHFGFDGETFKVVVPNNSLPSIKGAIEIVTLMRAEGQEQTERVRKILISNKWRALRIKEAIIAAQRYFSDLLGEVQKPVKHIARTTGHANAKRIYYERKSKLL